MCLTWPWCVDWAIKPQLRQNVLWQQTSKWSNSTCSNKIYLPENWYFFWFLEENIFYMLWYSLEAPQWGASNEYPQHIHPLNESRELTCHKSRTQTLTLELWLFCGWWGFQINLQIQLIISSCYKFIRDIDKWFCGNIIIFEILKQTWKLMSAIMNSTFCGIVTYFCTFLYHTCFCIHIFDVVIHSIAVCENLFSIPICKIFIAFSV